MLKIISAALVAASVFVAPAMAGTARTGHAPAVKSVTHKSNALNANAKMSRHHHHRRHVRHHRHRVHKQS
jgi:Ni/Co efflux regulator RcnB